MNTRVSYQKTCSHHWNNISYNKSNQSRKKPKKNSWFCYSIRFSLCNNRENQCHVNLFLTGLKSLNFQNCVKRLMGCFSLGEYVRPNINVSNFVSLYLRICVQRYWLFHRLHRCALPRSWLDKVILYRLRFGPL